MCANDQRGPTRAVERRRVPHRVTWPTYRTTEERVQAERLFSLARRRLVEMTIVEVGSDLPEPALARILLSLVRKELGRHPRDVRLEDLVEQVVWRCVIEAPDLKRSGGTGHRI